MNQFSQLPPNIQSHLRMRGIQTAVRASGGLSQSKVYRCSGGEAEFCLRAWPPGISGERLEFIQRHCHEAIQQGAVWIPKHLAFAGNLYFMKEDGAYWEFTTWLPGDANYLADPTDAKLGAACSGLARLHALWARSSAAGPSPAVRDRIERLTRLLEFQRPSLDQVSQSQCEQRLVTESLVSLQRFGPPALDALRRIAPQPVTLHFVIRDVWSAHVLFEGDELSGIIDFGAARIDEPATDVARLLGSLEPCDRRRWLSGLASYTAVSPVVQQRVEVLDLASTLLSAWQWLEWLVVQQRDFPVQREQLTDRWALFLKRLQQFDWDVPELRR